MVNIGGLGAAGGLIQTPSLVPNDPNVGPLGAAIVIAPLTTANNFGGGSGSTASADVVPQHAAAVGETLDVADEQPRSRRKSDRSATLERNRRGIQHQTE